MNKRILFMVAACLALSGCAVNYTLDGTKYDSKEKFQSAVDSNISTALAQTTPLTKPLTKKKLLFAIPTYEAFRAEHERRYLQLGGPQPIMGQAREMIDNLQTGNRKFAKAMYDAVEKRGIYTAIQLKDMDSLSGSFAASEDMDCLYYVEPVQGAGQWFFTSAKFGKQIFAYDLSSGTMRGKVLAFVEALQAQVIRE